ncbi:hypothetical protein VKT23_012341 [Stygiomarasmius scandens]|uniref:Uncharacterized protein n=1 Tax=Marasmiellus scandens TaxID=2682957 RepID=A0ABR1JAF7_9AGAR
MYLQESSTTHDLSTSQINDTINRAGSVTELAVGLNSLSLEEHYARPCSPSPSQLAGRLEALCLDDDEAYTMPGSFSSNQSSAHITNQDNPSTPSRTQNRAIPGLPPRMEASNGDVTTRSITTMESLVAAATLTATPIDVSSHDKLFTSSDEFYQKKTATLPDSLRSLDLADAVESLDAVMQASKPSFSPAFRPSLRFGRSPPPKHLSQTVKSRSPSPIGHHLGKLERDESKELEQMNKKLHHHIASVFDVAFASLSVDSQWAAVDAATDFLRKGLVRVGDLETKQKCREKSAKYRGISRPASNDATLQDKRVELRDCMRSSLTKISKLVVPSLPGRPLKIDTGKTDYYTFAQTCSHTSRLSIQQ